MGLRKILVVNYDKCTGCQLCELACSFAHHKVFNIKLSRITIIRNPHNQLGVPVYCVQCEDALCKQVCPVSAIHKDAKTGAYIIDYDKCIGCRECVYVCPFGAMNLDLETGKPIKCDLCGGDPACVKICPTEALIYEVPTVAERYLKRMKLEKLIQYMQIKPS